MSIERAAMKCETLLLPLVLRFGCEGKWTFTISAVEEDGVSMSSDQYRGLSSRHVEMRARRCTRDRNWLGVSLFRPWCLHLQICCSESRGIDLLSFAVIINVFGKTIDERLEIAGLEWFGLWGIRLAIFNSYPNSFPNYKYSHFHDNSHYKKASIDR